MVLPAILIAVGSVIAGIWAGVKAVAEATFQVLRVIFDYAWNLFVAFYQNAPKIVRLLLFLFLMLFLGNAIIGFIMHLNFYCTTGNELLQPKGFLDGVKVFFTTSFTDIENNTLTYTEFLANNTIPAQQYSKNNVENIFYPKCINQNPRLLLFGVIDFLDYKLWVMIFLIGILFSFYQANK